MIVLKVTKKQGFTISVENTFLEKPQGSQINHPSAFLGSRNNRGKEEV